MSDKVVTSSGGISFCGLLTIVFIVLKLTGFINWSWFWVLSPMIFSISFTVLILLIVFALVIWANSK